MFVRTHFGGGAQRTNLGAAASKLPQLLSPRKYVQEE